MGDPGFEAALALHRAGRLDDAESAYRALLADDPAHADALNLLGAIALQRGSYDDALDLVSRSLRARPLSPIALNHLALALEGRAQFAEAENAYREALRLRPEYADAWHNLGNVLRYLCRPDDATEAYRRAVRLAPDQPAFCASLASELFDGGQLREAIAMLRRQVELTGDPSVHSGLLFWLLHDPDITDEALFAEHREWARRHEGSLPDEAAPHDKGVTAIGSPRPRIHPLPVRRGREGVGGPLPGMREETPTPTLPRGTGRGGNAVGPQTKVTPYDNDPYRPLRVGYVSADFREHAVARFVAPLIENHDPSRVTAVCYSDVTEPDGVTARLKQRVPEWRDVAGMTDEAVARLVRRDRIDVLVDLGGHTAGNRLLVFARRPAPVQAAYCGYPYSAGLRSIQYRITDGWCDPPGATERAHSEELVRVDGCAWCYRPGEAPPVNDLPALAAGRVTFGSLNRIPKVSSRVAALWARVLAATPGSRLLVLCGAGEENGSVRRLLEDAGVEGDRLQLVPGRPREGYLRYAQEIDVALDTFPYTGMTTSCELLWMGVPVITLAGPEARGRATASVLRAIGLPELIADTAETYVRIASELAGNLSRLGDLRAGLRERMESSPLRDEAGTPGKLEAAYRAMWSGSRARPVMARAAGI